MQEKESFIVIPPAYKVWGVGYTVFRLSMIPSFHDSDFVSAQYLENELIELDQILHMH